MLLFDGHRRPLQQARTSKLYIVRQEIRPSRPPGPQREGKEVNSNSLISRLSKVILLNEMRKGLEPLDSVFMYVVADPLIPPPPPTERRI